MRNTRMSVINMYNYVSVIIIIVSVIIILNHCVAISIGCKHWSEGKLVCAQVC